VLRWRPDKTPEQCDFDQLDEPVPVGLDTVLDGLDAIGATDSGADGDEG
jgi:hypothetical protein